MPDTDIETGAETGNERDTALRARLAADHRAAFRDYVEAYQHSVYSGLRRLAPSAADAEDLAQETFVRAFRAFERYEPERIESLRLSGWTWTIALNLARNAARTRSRRPVTVEATWDGPDLGAGVDDLMDHDEWARRLEALNGPQRSGVVLRHVVGLSYEEIAEATGRAVGTVKADVHRGLARLRRIMDEEAA